MRGVTQAFFDKKIPKLFQLTRLMRGVTILILSIFLLIKISTHTPHARRDEVHMTIKEMRTISTHTPHARRDSDTWTVWEKSKISTHTPHARRDPLMCGYITRSFKFQLTRLMRGVTGNTNPDNKNNADFNSHASCEA